jgi:cyclic pyranopterin phosphate synthase
MSVTDRCNLRCRYCMPEEDYTWLPRSSLLTFEELERLARVFVAEGVNAIRLTGGEPLLRRGLPELVRRLAGIGGLDDLALTTNGTLLSGQLDALAAAGLRRVTVSLDTLRPERAEAFARTRLHAQVVEGIRAAGAAGLRPLKLNTVVVRGFNDDELADLVRFGREAGAEVRFIEYMDVGGATGWTLDQVVTRDEIVARLAAELGPVSPRPDPGDPSAPAERFQLADGTSFGVIASVTAPFCGRCDRSRLTADGTWFTCLYAAEGTDLRDPVRAGLTDTELRTLVAGRWSARADRGAEQRLEAGNRQPLFPLEALRRDPHKEMHTRGG